jgi:hypothetical protein
MERQWGYNRICLATRCSRPLAYLSHLGNGHNAIPGDCEGLAEEMSHAI